MAPQRHVVVFDCNVYLDVVRLLGGDAFSWSGFRDLVARHQAEPVPAGDRAIDSLRAIALTESGRMAGREPLEVWTCDHIDGVVQLKAAQPIDGDEGDRGLGLSAGEAAQLVDDLIYGCVEWSGGDSIGDPYPRSTPPLDHEDGKVLGACRAIVHEDPLAVVYCVTRDRGFLAAAAAKQLDPTVHVMSPSKFVALVRLARKSAALRAIPRP